MAEVVQQRNHQQPHRSSSPMLVPAAPGSGDRNSLVGLGDLNDQLLPLFQPTLDELNPDQLAELERLTQDVNTSNSRENPDNEVIRSRDFDDDLLIPVENANDGGVDEEISALTDASSEEIVANQEEPCAFVPLEDEDSTSSEDASPTEETAPPVPLSALLSRSCHTRELVIAEDFLPGIMIDDGSQMGADSFSENDSAIGMYTYWIFQPAMAAAQLEFDTEESNTTERPNSTHYFVSVTSDFVWSVGCTPVYQNILMPVAKFNDELRRVLHRAGWYQDTVDVNVSAPYHIFHDWSLVHLRQVQAELSLTTDQSIELLRPLNDLCRDRGKLDCDPSFGPEWDSFTDMLQVEHTIMQKQHIKRTHREQLDKYSRNHKSGITTTHYFVLTRNRLLPLHTSGAKKLPSSLWRQNSQDNLETVPLIKHERMRWSIVKGKVVKRKRRIGENTLKQRPDLSPVEESLAGLNEAEFTSGSQPIPIMASHKSLDPCHTVHSPQDLTALLQPEGNDIITDMDMCSQDYSNAELGSDLSHYHTLGEGHSGSPSYITLPLDTEPTDYISF